MNGDLHPETCPLDGIFSREVGYGPNTKIFQTQEGCPCPRHAIDSKLGGFGPKQATPKEHGP
jgi:hypothetical protein